MTHLMRDDAGQLLGSTSKTFTRISGMPIACAIRSASRVIEGSVKGCEFWSSTRLVRQTEKRIIMKA
jgi:hypothetical protein